MARGAAFDEQDYLTESSVSRSRGHPALSRRRPEFNEEDYVAELPRPTGPDVVSQLGNLRNLQKLLTEGVPQAAGVFARGAKESLVGPSRLLDLQRRHPWLRAVPPVALADIAVRLLGVPGAAISGLAELGPEKAKPLTETLIGLSPLFLGRKLRIPRAAPVEAPRQAALPPGRELLALPGRVEGEPIPAPGGMGPVPSPGVVGPQPALPAAPLTLRRRPELESRLLQRIHERKGTAKAPYAPEKPLEVKGAPLEGEVLDQFGRPIPPEGIPPPTMTERERLRSLYKGRLGERRTETPPSGAEAPPLPAGPSPEAPTEVPRVLAPPAPPVPSPAGLRWRQWAGGTRTLGGYMSEDGRFRVEQMTPDLWVAQDTKRLGGAQFPTFHEARRWATARAAVSAPTTMLEKSPLYEKTRLGQQAVLPGAEARAIPATKTTAKVPQAAPGGLFEKPTPAVQEALPETPALPRGQHYGKTVDTGTVDVTNPEDVRIYLRDRGGIKPTPDLDRAAVPSEFIKPSGVAWNELVQEIADAQGKRPKDIERALTRTLGRYGTMRQELRQEGLLTEIRESVPPKDIAVSAEEWRGMGPSDRQAVIEWFRDVFRDERGYLNIGAMLDGWKRWGHQARQRFPMEEAVRKARPDSPVISEVERWTTGLADGLQRVVKTPWWQRVKHLNPETIKDAEEAAVNEWKVRGQTYVASTAARRHFPQEVQAAMRHREQQLAREQASRAYFGLKPIPERGGPYIPRKVEAESREAVSLGAGTLGRGRGLQTTVRGHGQERTFETFRQGEQTGLEYQDPRNSILMREWEGLKLRATHRLFQNLEAKGALFRDRGRAAAASSTGQPWRIENAPGGEWWTATEAEAKFLQQNLTESMRGPTASLVGYGNALLRNPNLVNPAPHVVKNMAMKALLARGPVTPYVLARDAVEWARSANPPLLREFNEAMPFSASGRTAGDILGRELRSGSVGDAVRGALRVLGQVNRPSQRVIFEWADPAMRYSLFKHYRQRGFGVYEAGNHAWVDLIRYGTRSQVTDRWKAWPLNFFVPWRYGTFVSLVKQVQNHPVRTALLIGAVDYLREVRYRTQGRWTHLPWDYVEAPIAQIVQSKDRYEFGRALGSQVALTALFGPGGAFAASQMDDILRILKANPQAGDYERLSKMLWGVGQLYDVTISDKPMGGASGVLGALLLGEHNTLTYQPRRLFRGLSERLPGLEKSPLVRQAEALQQRRTERLEKRAQHRATHPSKSIEDRLREQGYLR